MPEQTDFTTQLPRLSPEVDEAAARELFERRRQPSGTPRWLLPAAVVVLIVAGVAGLVLVTGDEADAPATPVDTTLPDEPDAALRPEPGETLIAGEEYFDVITVAETTVGFGNAELLGSTDELSTLWAEWNPGVDQPAVDLARNVAVVMTRPDNACADVVTQFEVTDRDGVPVWTPVFESLVNACDDPLLSWIHVVAIDRTALGDRALIRIPAAGLYEVPEQILEYTAPAVAPDQSADPAPVTLTATDVVVPLPPVGEPALHNTGAGMFYVVQHDGGDVSVLPATIDRRATEDEGVTMLRSFVVASESGGSFYGDGDIWDAWGRAATAGRSADLVGYAGRVVGDEVEVLYSDAIRIEGDPEVPNGEEYPLPPRPPLETITPEQFPALSSSGPVWRMFDAELVVENGVGRICRVDTSGPHPWERCGEQSVVLDTLVTSDQPGITTWFVSPILVFQDPIRGLTEVIPLSGNASHNDAAFSVTLEDVSITCTEPELDATSAVGSFTLEVPTTVRLAVVDGGGELGWIEVDSGGVEQIDFLFALDRPPGPDAEFVIEPFGGQPQRFPLPQFEPTSCLGLGGDAWEPPSSSGPNDDIAFRLVSRAGAGSFRDGIMWATDRTQIDSLITQSNRFGAVDDIDFDSEIALLVSIGRNECGPLFAGLDVVDGVIRPRTTTTGATSCDDYLANETVVLAVPRTELDATVAAGFRYPVTVDDEGSVVRFEQATGRFVSMGDEFSVTGVERSCTATDAAALRVRGVAPTVIDIDAELLVNGEVRSDPVRDTFGPDESSVLIPVSDNVDLTQPIAVSIRTADGARSIVLPPLAPSAIGDDPTCP